MLLFGQQSVNEMSNMRRSPSSCSCKVTQTKVRISTTLPTTTTWAKPIFPQTQAATGFLNTLSHGPDPSAVETNIVPLHLLTTGVSVLENPVQPWSRKNIQQIRNTVAGMDDTEEDFHISVLCVEE